jgi:Flp pilus assembly protein TadG
MTAVNKRLRDGSRPGQSLVEMALVLPLLMILLVGVVDVGRAMFAKIAITNASREGARYASRYPTYSTKIREAVELELEANGLEPTDVDLQVSFEPENSPPRLGDEVTVALAYPYDMILGGILGMGPIDIGAATRMIVVNIVE